VSLRLQLSLMQPKNEVRWFVLLCLDTDDKLRCLDTDDELRHKLMFNACLTLAKGKVGLQLHAKLQLNQTFAVWVCSDALDMHMYTHIFMYIRVHVYLLVYV
jgi:hypothetical protein